MWIFIVIFIIVIKVCRKVPSMVSLFLNTCLVMYLLIVLGDGRKNDEKVGIVSVVEFMGEFIKCCILSVHGSISRATM